jgi:transposase
MKRKSPKPLPLETQKFIRSRVVDLHKAGKYPDEIANLMDVSLRSVYRWIAAFAQHGEDALLPKPAVGPKSQLSNREMEKLAHIIIEKNPSQYQFEFKLWTLRRVQEIIRREFGHSFSYQWVSVILKRLGFTPQRPRLASVRKDDAWVQRWQTEELPALKKRAAEEKAEIWYGDEASFRIQEKGETTWGKRGKTPVVKSSGARGGINIISAVTAHGELEFAAYDRNVNAIVFVSFLRFLLEGRSKKIILVLDNSSVHKNKLVNEFVAEHNERLEIVYLPTYSPELNPDELVWAHAKKKVRSVVSESVKSFKGLVVETLAALKGKIQLIQSFVAHCA